MSKFTLRANTCDCHPETCCCDPYAIYHDDKKWATIYDHEKGKRIVDALNIDEQAIREDERRRCADIIKSKIFHDGYRERLRMPSYEMIDSIMEEGSNAEKNSNTNH